MGSSICKVVVGTHQSINYTINLLIKITISIFYQFSFEVLLKTLDLRKTTYEFSIVKRTK